MTLRQSRYALTVASRELSDLHKIRSSEFWSTPMNSSRRQDGLPTVGVDAEYILRVLIDEHRQQVRLDPEADPGATLSFRTSVADWRSACDLVAWRKLGHALNASWKINATESEWKSVLEPARQRTLRDVCQFLANRVQLPKLVPMGYLGASCASAGAFFGIRSALAEQGIDTRGIKPSTELATYAALAPVVFISFAARIAPGRLPGIDVETRFWTRSSRVTFGILRTFRDYAECLAKNPTE
jgi:hypothetical protein